MTTLQGSKQWNRIESNLLIEKLRMPLNPRHFIFNHSQVIFDPNSLAYGMPNHPKECDFLISILKYDALLNTFLGILTKADR